MLDIKKINKLSLILLYILTFINIASFGFPIILDIILILLLLNFIKKNRLIALNTNIVLIISLLLIPVIFKIEESENFYRGHEKFDKKTSYKKNISEIINMPHGDLIAIDVCNDNTKELAEKRKQIFITDNYGFRNSKTKIEKTDLLLIGDSIVAGSGLSDEYILSNQINNSSNIKTANIAVGGATPWDYEAMLIKYLNLIHKKAKIYLFYFEGNDFKISNPDKIPKNSYKNVKIEYYKYKIRFGYERLERNKDKLFIKNLNYENFFYKKIRPKSQRFFKKIMLKWTDSCEVQYDLIDEKLIGFFWLNRNEEYKYKTYILENTEVLKRISKVFFVPTKASVYKEYTENIINFETNKFLFLEKSYNKKNIEVIDLTLPLKLNIKKYLQNGEFLYFRDDTHLNKNGIEVITNYILKNIN